MKNIITFSSKTLLIKLLIGVFMLMVFSNTDAQKKNDFPF